MSVKRLLGWVRRKSAAVLTKTSPPAARAATPRPATPRGPAQPTNLIDVRDLMRRLSVEQLCVTAERYFSGMKDWDSILAKPFLTMSETPELLICLAQLLRGIEPIAGSRILDFGAGTGWTSHAMTQLGAEVISCDVSETALKIGQRLYERRAIFGNRPAARFLHFDGRKLALPDEHVDRVTCLDAFHHVPNPAEVMLELGRVLKTGGVAAFSEPGPNHSASEGAQYEMAHHDVVENDVVIEDIWAWAKEAGFTKLRLAVFSPVPLMLSLPEFNEFLAGGTPEKQLTHNTRMYVRNNRRMFFLTKGEPDLPDSRTAAGLAAKLTVRSETRRVRNGSKLTVRIRAENVGTVVWLPAGAAVGAVHAGCHLCDESGATRHMGYWVKALTADLRGVRPGEAVEIDAEVPAPPPGRHVLRFDLVAGQVAWFNVGDAPQTRLTVDVSAEAA